MVMRPPSHHPKPPHTTEVSHRANVIKLTVRPALAHVPRLSLTIATTLTPIATGGPNTTRTPPRNPRGEPHPKPGRRSSDAAPYSQGDKASQKATFPITPEFVRSYSMNSATPGAPNLEFSHAHSRNLRMAAGEVKAQRGRIHHRGMEIAQRASHPVMNCSFPPILRALCASVVKIASFASAQAARCCRMRSWSLGVARVRA